MQRNKRITDITILLTNTRLDERVIDFPALVSTLGQHRVRRFSITNFDARQVRVVALFNQLHAVAATTIAHLSVRSCSCFTDDLLTKWNGTKSLLSICLGGTDVTDDGFAEFAASCPQLQQIELAGFGFTEECLLEVASCADLRYLNVTGCRKMSMVNTEKIVDVIRCCAGLQDLSLVSKYLQRLGGTQLREVLRGLRAHTVDLRYLDVHCECDFSCGGLREDMSLFTQRFSDNLRSLKITSGDHLMGDAFVGAIASNCRQLQSLTLYSLQFDEDSNDSVEDGACVLMRQLLVNNPKMCTLELSFYEEVYAELCEVFIEAGSPWRIENLNLLSLYWITDASFL